MDKIVSTPSGSSHLSNLPVLPLRDIVVFPNMIVPLFVGREQSIQSLKNAMSSNQKILLLTQKDPSLETPKNDDLYKMGTVAQVLQMLKLPDGTVKVLVEGEKRAKIVDLNLSKDCFRADVTVLSPINDNVVRNKSEAHVRTANKLFEKYLKLNPKIPQEALTNVMKITNPSGLADTLAAHLLIKVEKKQHLLEIIDINDRLEAICGFMEAEIGILEAEKRIRSRVKHQMEKSQREYYLNEQIKAIQKELGTETDLVNEADEIFTKIKKLKLTKEAREKAEGELKKLKAMNPMSSEATVVRGYLDWLLGIPWSNSTKIKKDIFEAEKTLNKDHYGLEKVKERIIEHLAVQSRVGKVNGSILCLVGPPGVGKTSLGESIAKATGRKFVRVALGGVSDESEIRGHRRTYIGSMPGKLVQGMKKAGSSNPLFLLDEIDKLGSDWRGDPSSALLEVLDPEQNDKFNDHYLEVDYNLSDVMFVTTANSMNMAQPLLDRMEIIRLSGYTEDEKVKIACKHLIPKQKEKHGLAESEWSISDKALREVIRYYTREAGVRALEREISKLLRKALKDIISDKKKKTIKITERTVSKYLGVRKYLYGEQESNDMVGTTTGLAWTEVGGDILFIEALMVAGKGKMTITGKLGEVMQESVQAAASFVKSNATNFGITPVIFEKNDIHIHVPEGATPKDGPSAGIAICTSIVSMLTGIPVKKDVAMTGEITLRGRVLPIGGLKEKLLAAHRSGIKTVIIPKENEKDLVEIPANVTDGLRIVPVSYVGDVIRTALVKQPKSIIWSNDREHHPTGKKDDVIVAH